MAVLSGTGLGDAEGLGDGSGEGEGLGLSLGEGDSVGEGLSVGEGGSLADAGLGTARIAISAIRKESLTRSRDLPPTTPAYNFRSWTHLCSSPSRGRRTVMEPRPCLG